MPKTTEGLTAHTKSEKVYAGRKRTQRLPNSGVVVCRFPRKREFTYAGQRQRVWRRRPQRYAEAAFNSTCTSLVVEKTCNNKTRLVVFDRNVNVQVYVNQVLADGVVPFMQNNFTQGDGILQ